MSRKGEKIYKRKDGRWEGRYKKTVDGKGATKRALQPTAEPSTAHATEKHIVKQKKSWKSTGKCRRREQRAPVVQSAFPITVMNGCYSGKLM